MSEHIYNELELNIALDRALASTLLNIPCPPRNHHEWHIRRAIKEVGCADYRRNKVWVDGSGHRFSTGKRARKGGK